MCYIFNEQIRPCVGSTCDQSEVVYDYHVENSANPHPLFSAYDVTGLVTSTHGPHMHHEPVATIYILGLP